MKSAIVTGSSSGIGKECAKKLLDIGYRVYGISKKCTLSHADYVHISQDLTDIKALKSLSKLIDNKPYILINSAGVGHFASHEELSFEQIQEIITLNLTAPMLLCKLFLKDLKQNRGYIFNINSISGIQPALFGATYGASKAGLRHFGTSLFKEARKSGLKVVNINPDITNSNFFDNLHFEPSKDSLTYIEPKDIADIIENILNLREGSVVTDITIEPQKFQISKKK